MPFVLDASVALSWAFPDERNQTALRAEQLLQTEDESALAPALWWYEVRNILIVNERRGRITAAGTALYLREIAGLRIVIDAAQDDRLLLDLARQTRLTVYDAAYLDMAIRERLPLATLDKALQAAALAMGVPLLV